jgi:transcriptional regulator with PAS, ATPase and Fis domain
LEAALRVYPYRPGDEFTDPPAASNHAATESCAPDPHVYQVGADPGGLLDSVKDLQSLLDLSPPAKNHELVFQSARMANVVAEARRFARSSATVLLYGESGTGKELVARLIHDASPRVARRYARVNCAALPEALIESELFGHQRGAFTGAVDGRIGRFEWADEGTLLLDEISELPLTLQAKLLRVLEEGEFQRVGDNETRQANVRVVATTNRDLWEQVNSGRFRADLYHRLGVLEIRVPALRERPEDIPVLVKRFISWFRGESPVAVRGASEVTERLLIDYPWPGNVRQLRNVIHRACILATTDLLQPVDLPPLPPLPDAFPTGLLNHTLDEIERLVVLEALRRCSGNKTAAARQLGVTARTLANKLNRYRQHDQV